MGVYSVFVQWSRDAHRGSLYRRHGQAFEDMQKASNELRGRAVKNIAAAYLAGTDCAMKGFIWSMWRAVVHGQRLFDLNNNEARTRLQLHEAWSSLRNFKGDTKVL